MLSCGTPIERLSGRDPVEQTLHYLFSAIAQTLAGILGIIGAVAYFRIEILGRRISRAADAVLAAVRKGCGEYWEEMDELYDRGLWNELRQHASAVAPILSGSELQRFDRQFRVFCDQLDVRDSLATRLKALAVGSALTICLSVVCLIGTPVLASAPFLAFLAAGIVACAAAYHCLAFADLVIHSFVEQASEKPVVVYCVRSRFKTTKEKLGGWVQQKPLNARQMKRVDQHVRRQVRTWAIDKFPDVNVIVHGTRCFAEHPAEEAPQDDRHKDMLKSLDGHVNHNLDKWVRQAIEP